MINSIAGYNRDSIIADKIGVEGGDVNNPDDRGGATRFGVTQTTANQYKGYLTTTYGWNGDIATLTGAMAIYIYTVGFWNVMNLDAIFAVHPLIADKMFDIGINMGTSRAGIFLQTALNALNKNGSWYADMNPDGKIGSVTVMSLQSYVAKRGATMGVWHILVMLLSQQGSRFIDLATADHSQETFEDGWEDRVGRDMGHYSLLMGYAV